MKNKIQISIISILLTLLLILIICNLIYIFSPPTNSESYSTSERTIQTYEDTSNEYMSDEEVVNVYEICLDSEIKSVCVYENIEFIWSKSHESLRDGIFFSPTELVKYHGQGVCRDISVFRMAVFKKLNVPAEFVFTKTHVYLKSFEKGNVYELNNEYLFVDDIPFMEIK